MAAKSSRRASSPDLNAAAVPAASPVAMHCACTRIDLADSCELPEEIDIKRAEEARERAEEKLRQKQSIKEYYQTQAALNRAMNRLKVSQKHFK